MTKTDVTYVGPHDEVEIAGTDVVVKRGESVSVDTDLAEALFAQGCPLVDPRNEDPDAEPEPGNPHWVPTKKSTPPPQVKPAGPSKPAGPDTGGK